MNLALGLAVLLPAGLDARRLAGEASELRTRVAALRLSAERTAHADRLREAAEKLKAGLPTRKEIPDVVRDLQSIAHESDVEVLGIQAIEAGGTLAPHGKSAGPKTEEGHAGRGLLAPLSYQMPVEGTYAALRAFIRDIESAERFFAIRDLALRKVRGEDRVQMQITVTTFVRPEAP